MNSASDLIGSIFVLLLVIALWWSFVFLTTVPVVLTLWWMGVI